MRTFLAATTGLPTIPPTTTYLIVRPLHRLVPDERGPSVLSEARTGV
jgi:hypothetical protein